VVTTCLERSPDAMASTPEIEPDVAYDGPPLSVPDTGEVEAGESGKLKMIVQLLRKCMGIKDIASMSVSNDLHC
jgi:oxysterol-binding protein-related protein 9/10/11